MKDMNKHKEENKKETRRKERTRSKLFGTSARPRISVFKSNKYVYLQAIDDSAHNTIAFGKTASALAAKLKKMKVELAIFDRGAYQYHGGIKKIADEIRKNGIKI